MLIMPVDRITLLLEQAAEVEIPDLEGIAESEAAAEAERVSDDLEVFADSPAYRNLAEALAGLTLPEVYELLAVGIIGESDRAEDAWELAVQEAQSIAAEDALDELARILVLTDAIESGLDRLGYSLDEENETESADDEEELEGEEEEEGGEEEEGEEEEAAEDESEAEAED